MDKVGRNDPCPCGSGKKFKKCCGSTATTPPKKINAQVLTSSQSKVASLFSQVQQPPQEQEEKERSFEVKE